MAGIRIEQLDLESLSRLFVNNNKESIIRGLIQYGYRSSDDRGRPLTDEDLDRLGIHITPTHIFLKITEGWTVDQLKDFAYIITGYLSIEKLRELLSQFTDSEVESLGWGLDSFRKNLKPPDIVAMIKTLNRDQSADVTRHLRDGVVDGLAKLTDEEKRRLGVNELRLLPNIADHERSLYIDDINMIMSLIRDYIAQHLGTAPRDVEILENTILDLDNLITKNGGFPDLLNTEKTSSYVFAKFIQAVMIILYRYKGNIDKVGPVSMIIANRFDLESQVLNYLVAERVFVSSEEIILPNPFGPGSYPIVRAFRYKYGAGMTTSSPAGGSPPEIFDIGCQYDDDIIYIKLPMMFEGESVNIEQIEMSDDYRFSLTFRDNSIDNITLQLIDVRHDGLNRAMVPPSPLK